MGKYEGRVNIKVKVINRKRKRVWFLSNNDLDKFGPNILGLGDVASPSEQVEAIAAIFDLSGFTKFCSQVDPHLSAPTYLSEFLNWLFLQVKKQMIQNKLRNGVQMYSDLPFLAKFLGDGVLFLWDAQQIGSDIGMCNVVLGLHNICEDYSKDFYPRIKKNVVDPPERLRCGIARGKVCSVGNAEDYVGPCINIAARLQKLSDLTFCCSRRGFDFDEHMGKREAKLFTIKAVDLRGIRDNELVWVPKLEFDALPPKQKTLFRKP